MAVPLTAVATSLSVIACMVLLGLHNRRRLRATQGGFPCRTRRLPRAGDPSRWRAGHAAWCHDVLLIFSGPALRRVEVLPVLALEPAAVAAPLPEGLGPTPEVVRLRLDDGRRIEVAARSEQWAALPGPFAGLPSLAAR